MDDVMCGFLAGSVHNTWHGLCSIKSRACWPQNESPLGDTGTSGAGHCSWVAMFRLSLDIFQSRQCIGGSIFVMSPNLASTWRGMRLTLSLSLSLSLSAIINSLISQCKGTKTQARISGGIARMLNLRHSSSPLNWTRTYLYNNVGPRGRQKCNDMQPCIQTEDCRPQFRQYIEGVYGGFLAGVFEKYLGAQRGFWKGL